MKYHDDRIYQIPQFLSAEECTACIELAEKRGFEEAKIDIGGHRQVIRKDIRDNERVFIKDEKWAESLWQRLAPHVPVRLGNSEAVGLNELFRIYKYEKGQQFRKHRDGSYHRNDYEASFYTLLIYLNETFTGGQTWLEDQVIVPRTGLAVVFLHDILHAGLPVPFGTKYLLRSDVMFRWAENPPS